MEQRQVASIILIVIFMAIYFPASVYGVFHLYKKRKEMYMQKRHMHVTCALCIAYLLTPISFSSYFIVVIAAHDPKSLIAIIAPGFAWIVVWALMYGLLCKNWLKYFALKWTYYTLKQKWESIIAPNHNDKARNWFRSHHHNFGNFRYVTKRIGILYSFTTAFSIFGRLIVPGPNFQTINLAQLIVFAVVPLFIICFKTYFKNSSFYFVDNFQIEWESMMQLRCLLGVVFVQVVSIIVIYIIGEDNTAQFGNHIFVFSLCSCFALMSWISTVRVIQRNSASNAERAGDSTPKSGKLQIEQILSNMDALNIFVEHLAQEFSVELLCSYIEFHQFESWVINTFEITDTSEIKQINLPEDLVTSSAVTNNDKVDSEGQELATGDRLLVAKHKAFQLHGKYTAVGSQYEINVSGTMRHTLDTFFFDNYWADFKEFPNLTANDLMTVFEEAKEEQKQLMIYSLDRFESNPDNANVIPLLCTS